MRTWAVGLLGLWAACGGEPVAPEDDTDEAPEETDSPTETDAAAETDVPAETDLPDTDEAPAETDPPDTDPPDTDPPDTDPPDTDTETDLPDTAPPIDTAFDPCAAASIELALPGPPLTRLYGGETALVEAGPQGGFHIWLGLQLFIVNGPTTIRTTIDLIGGPRVSEITLRRNITPQMGCETELSDIQAVLDFFAVGLTLRDLDGMPARVEVTATQPGRSLTDAVDIVIDVP
jgi:hypothetical protein